MVKFAVFVNILQIGIITFLVIQNGLGLGIVTIFLLMVMMTVPFINFLTLLFSHTSSESNEKKGRQKTGRLIKRSDFRINYHTADSKPVIIINKQNYEVLDISEGGIRFASGDQIRFRKRFFCQIDLLCGKQMKLKAYLVRIENREVAARFRESIPKLILTVERNHIRRMLKKKA